MFRRLSLLIPLLVLAACSPPPEPPPRPADLDALDPLVAESVVDAIKSVEQKPDDPAKRARLAMVYQANALVVQAEHAWRQALAGDRTNANWWYQWGRMLVANDNPEGGLDALARAAAIDGSYGPLHWRRGFWLLELGRLDEAEAMFQTAEQCADGDVPARLGRARVHLSRGNADAAVALLEPLRRAQPQSGYVNQLLGVAYRQQGRFPEASAVMRLADGVKPSFPDPWSGEVVAERTGLYAVFAKVDWLVQNGHFDAAIAALDDLSRDRPGNALVLAKRGETYLFAGNPRAARDVLETALREDPDAYFARLHLANVHQQLGDTDEAMRQFDRILETHPGFGPAWGRKADLLFERGDWAGAESALRQAIRAGQDDDRTHVLLAGALIRQGRTPEADAVLTGFLARHPQDLNANLALAANRMDRGDYAGAEMPLRQAREIDPANADVQRLLRQYSSRSGGGG